MAIAEVRGREWSITDVAKAAGTTSRTLRHYGQLGLLEPSRIGANGYRYYDRSAIVRLQRILLLRELGLGLGVIAEVLDREVDERRALRDHVRWLESERERLDRKLAAVRQTLVSLDNETEIDMNEMLDGFDYTVYEQEVTERWGADAYRKSAGWWESKTQAERDAFQREVADLNAAWIALGESGADATGPEAAALARRHVAWLRAFPGSPANNGPDASGHDPEAPIDESTAAYVRGLAEMYVADERFAANYGGADGAAFVRDALLAYVGEE